MKSREFVMNLDENILRNIKSRLSVPHVRIGDAVHQMLVALDQNVEGRLGAVEDFID